MVKLAAHEHGFVADTRQQARQIAFPPFTATMTRIGQERGWPPGSLANLEREAGPEGALVLGEPQEIVDKILAHHAIFGHQRTLIQMSVGTIPHDAMMRAVELMGTVVAPAVRKALGAPKEAEAGG